MSNRSEGQKKRWAKLRARAKKQGLFLRRGGRMAETPDRAIGVDATKRVQIGPAVRLPGYTKAPDPLAKERKRVAKKTDAELAQSLRGHVGFVNLIAAEAESRGLKMVMHANLERLVAALSKFVEL